MSSTAATIYNDIILGYIISYFAKADLFSDFDKGIKIEDIRPHDPTDSTAKLDPTMLSKLLHFCIIMGVLTCDAGVYSLTDLGRDLKSNRGFFTWAIGGYSPLFEEMGTFLESPKTLWQPYVRGEYVAIGSDECNRELMLRDFEQIIDDLPAHSVADLGCGNAGRLVDLLIRRPDLQGVGIDINPDAIETAKINRASHNLDMRLELICEDASKSFTSVHPAYTKVDVVMSFMMLHDLFNIASLKGKLFSQLKDTFPNAKYFVFADTCMDTTPSEPTPLPIFTMGFELAHALRSIETFPLSYYEKRFAEEGLTLIKRHSLNVPNTYLFVLQPSEIT